MFRGEDTIHVDGQPGDAALLAQLAPAWRFGDHLFETIRVTSDGRVPLARLHRARMASAAARALLPWPGDEAWREACLAPLGPGDAVRGLRVHLLPCIENPERGRFISYVLPWSPPVRAWEKGVALHVASIPHPGHGPWGKIGSYMWARIARREAAEFGAQEALMLRPGGEVVEAASAALLWREGQALCTCRQEAGGLESTTLAALRALDVPVEGVRAPLLRLRRADAVYLLSSLQLVVPVVRLTETGSHPTMWPVSPEAATLRGLLEDLSELPGTGV